MKKNRIIIVIVIVLLSGLMFTVFSRSSDGLQFKQLSGTDFVATYEDMHGAVLLDVRTPGEFMAGHIQGAQNLDFEDPSFSTKAQKLDGTKPYFVYCRSGNRSGQAIAILRQLGFQEVYELRGGIIGNQGSVALVSDGVQ